MLTVRASDAAGTSYFANVFHVTFADGTCTLSHSTGVPPGDGITPPAAQRTLRGCTCTLLTAHGEVLDERVLPTEEEHARAQLEGNTAETHRPRVRPRAKRR